MPEQEVMKLVVSIGADLKELKEGLNESKKAAKETASAVSFTGVAARKAMLDIANSSQLAGIYMRQFQTAIGAIADTIIAKFSPAIEPFIDKMYEASGSTDEASEDTKTLDTAIEHLGKTIETALEVDLAFPAKLAIMELIERSNENLTVWRNFAILLDQIRDKIDSIFRPRTPIDIAVGFNVTGVTGSSTGAAGAGGGVAGQVIGGITGTTLLGRLGVLK